MKSAQLKQRPESRKLPDGRKLAAAGALDVLLRISHGMPARKQEVAGEVYLDPVIHERTRLAILTALYTAPEGRSFSDLRDTLSLTDGNLMAHVRTLEEAALLERSKEGAGRASTTTLRLSERGQHSFALYLDQLEQLVRAARKH
jgi:DNA-binding MarR family transcriptional regulator